MSGTRCINTKACRTFNKTLHESFHSRLPKLFNNLICFCNSNWYGFPDTIHKVNLVPHVKSKIKLSFLPQFNGVMGRLCLCMSVSHSVHRRGSHVTITHDTLDIIDRLDPDQIPFLRHGNSLYRSKQETCSNLFTWRYLPPSHPPGADIVWHWSTYSQ